ncbi:MAG: winged helix-turn-helix transcriptional regulator [Candidatus Binataceae bacterium]
MTDHGYIRASSVHRALNVIGDRWSLLILRDSFLGVKRFQEWHRSLGIPRQRLTNRLKRLVDHGVLRKVRYAEKPVRYEYRLTAMGHDLYPLALMIRRWEDRWLSAGGQRWVLLVHSTCGQHTDARCVCGHCGAQIKASETRFEDGPGAGHDRTAPPRLQRRSNASVTVNDEPHLFIEQAVEVLGDRWAYLVLGGAFLGLRRFDALRRELGIATNILADRLKRLVNDGLFQRVPASDRPASYDYLLTEKGKDFFPVVVALMKWGDRWLAGDKGAPLIVYHRSCGHRLAPRFICDRCGGDLRAREVTYELAGGRAKAASSSPAAAAAK